MTNVKALFAPGAKDGRTKLNILFAALAMMVVSSTPLMAGDFEAGRYVIESAAHTNKFLRGLPKQGDKVVTAENPMATVASVLHEKRPGGG